jgi:8-oxo-dGTP pyrophosphatase MutT (NUDIX family)
MSNTSKSARRLQYGALPYRISKGRGAEFVLVTSRETHRWIIPKGWPKNNKSPHHSAAHEAFEEAGVLGIVGRRSVGSFSYTFEKREMGRVRSARLPARSNTPEEGMAREAAAPG